MARAKNSRTAPQAAEYRHQEKTPARPDVGTQPQSKKCALKDEYEDPVWQHRAGTTSVSFEAGEHGEVAVKVIDDRGNEQMVVKNLAEAS